jgi:hypothetical protein
MIHETRIIPVDGRPHISPKNPFVHGRLARPLGRRHDWSSRRTNFNGKVGLTRKRQHMLTSPELKLTERLTRIDAKTLQVRSDCRGHGHMDAAVEGGAAAHAASRVSVLRIRVPRG